MNKLFFDPSYDNTGALAADRAKFISNPHLERKEKQAYKNMGACRRKYPRGDYWHRTWCKLLSKLRGHGNKFIGWSDWGREEYYLHKPK
jgi:hypothetical protein